MRLDKLILTVIFAIALFFVTNSYLPQSNGMRLPFGQQEVQKYHDTPHAPFAAVACMSTVGDSHLGWPFETDHTSGYCNYTTDEQNKLAGVLNDLIFAIIYGLLAYSIVYILSDRLRWLK